MVAGATERLRLVTSVLVLPYRNPVLTAKMAASLDVLSGGRLTLGVGAGWLKEEFEALNSPAFEARGAVTDEWIAIFKQLWSQSPASFDGPVLPVLRYTLRTVPGAEAAPADLGRRAFARRVAAHRPAWRRLAPGRRGRRLAVAAARDARASRHAEAADRGRGARFLGADDLLQGAALRHRRFHRRTDPAGRFSGEPEEIADDIRTFAAIGVHELIFDCRGQSIAESIERLQWFAAEIMPLAAADRTSG